MSRKLCAAGPREGGGRHAVSKSRGAVSVTVAIEDRKRGNIATEFKRQKTITMRRRSDETTSLRIHSAQKICVSGAPPHVKCILHTRADKDPVNG